jgi:hypothetical protein
MRYGYQSLAEIESWTPAKLRWVADTLGEMLKAENPDSGD